MEQLSMGHAASRTQPAPLRAHALAGGFALMVWDGELPVRVGDVRIRVDDTSFRQPCCGCSLRLTTHRVRNVLLVATDIGDERPTFAVTKVGGGVLAYSESSQPVSSEFDTSGVLADIDRRDKPRLLRFFLETGPAAAAVGADPRWIRACRRLLAGLDCTRPLSVCCALGSRWRLYEDPVPASLCGPASAVLVSDRGLKRPLTTGLSPVLAGAPRRLLQLIVEEDTTPATVVVFVGAAAIVRTMPAATVESASVLSFLRQGSAGGEARLHLLYDGLAGLSSDSKAAAMLSELRRLLPQPAVPQPNDANSLAGIDLVIGSAAGLFIRGWFDIGCRPAAIEIDYASERHRLPIADLATYPLAEPVSAVGFVATLAVGNPEAPCRVRLQLASDLTLDLAMGPDHLDPLQARDRVMASWPASLTAQRAIEVIEPVAQALHLATVWTPTLPAEATIGPLSADPLVSIIVPLGTYGEALRCRVGRAAIAPEAAPCEFVYVLDRPSALAAAERLLTDLYRCYGIGGRLLLTPMAANPSSSFNLGAAAARGRYLLFLNSGTVPETVGWLQPLLSRLVHLGEAGAVAGTVIHPDQTLHQLGGDVGADVLGRWEPRWHAAGLPRQEMAQGEPLLLAAPGLLLAKTCFDHLGGFDPGYFHPTFRDADLSLRLREAGGRLAVVRSSLFVEFEDSPSPPSFSPETARELDRRRFERRWRALVDAIRPDPHGRRIPDDPSGTLPACAADRRRAA
ncbi:MAG: hypothetical protein U1E42_01440 [Rhodospirillales bacterium]